MHKDTMWAEKLISMQEEDGKWGCFHSLSASYGSPVTTERALRRLERLGFTIEDACIQKAVGYMADCLAGKKEIPDRREKLLDWDVFTSLILAAWIRRYASDIPEANQIAKQWSQMISAAFEGGRYSHKGYISAYYDIFGVPPKGKRLVDFVNFYTVSLLREGLEKPIESALVDYILEKEDGIYYVYSQKISSLPKVFESKQASQYLSAMELLADYRFARGKLQFVTEWLKRNQNQHGTWDMGKSVKDNVYFPLSDHWRRKGAREADCTERISNLLGKLSE
ncbi:MAG: hypothetical protein HFH62_12160 [Lachnospiraceae bacterium]|nr:hypothetical protein [Lachnospiraceae bacterium]